MVVESGVKLRLTYGNPVEFPRLELNSDGLT